MESLQEILKNHDSVIFFDGACNLCNGFVDLVIRADQKRLFLFGSLQGETAQILPPEIRKNFDTIALLKADGQLLLRSKAIFYIFAKLGYPYRLISYFSFLPESVADFFYRFVAHNRGLMGTQLTCRIPTPEERSQFVN